MKFRALMTDTSVMKDFMSTMLPQAFPSSLKKEDNGPRRPLAWCELPVSFYFKEYNVIGVNEEYNEIYLEFSTALLARSVSLLKQSVKSLKIKLTNKDSPCLTLEMELASGNIESRQCVHDIPVEVISRKHWNDYEEPRFNDFHVSIEMPNLKTIKTIVERMRNMSHSLIVSATKDGRLTLQIKTNIVTLSAHFPDLSIESFAIGQLQLTPDSQNEEDSQRVSESDGFPQFICKECTERARDAFNFRMLCEESDMYLRINEILDIEENEEEIVDEDRSSDPEKIKEQLKCRSCNMVFYYKKPLIKHEQKHKEGFSCKDCGKNYASAKHLAIHISIKKRKGSHLCQICVIVDINMHAKPHCKCTSQGSIQVCPNNLTAEYVEEVLKVWLI
ncbi:hypothetical protein MTP99_001801 [Tenebrio molitor]|nr:hypothetical protein MTP99_001801 [Tenebrio molitor]